MIERYRITNHYLDWEVIVAIDHEKAALSIKEMVEFWGGHIDHLARFDGNYTQAFLTNLGAACLRAVIGERLGLQGLIKHFENLEGWVPMDGRYGITIVSVDVDPIDRYDLDISEAK